MISEPSESFKRKILETFKEAPPLDHQDLITEKDSESLQVRKFLKGRRRYELTLDVLRKDYTGDHNVCATFMSRKALAYFLPSYMFIALDNYDEADVTYDFFIYNLARAGDENLHSYLSSEQRKVVAEFLNYLYFAHETELDNVYSAQPAKQALDKFWRQFL